MKEHHVTLFAQIATGLALLLGLALVWVELRQAKSLSLAELTSQGFSELTDNARTIMGENPAISISKSCFAPETLNEEDMVVLDAYYRAQAAQIDRLRILEAVADFGVPWQQYAEQLLADVLSQEFGRRWFEENLAFDPQLASIRDDILAVNIGCSAAFEKIAIE